MAYFPKGYFRRFCVGVDYQAPAILKTVRQLGTRKANKVNFTSFFNGQRLYRKTLKRSWTWPQVWQRVLLPVRSSHIQPCTTIAHFHFGSTSEGQTVMSPSFPSACLTTLLRTGHVQWMLLKHSKK